MTLAITPVFAALLALLYVVLTVRVVAARRSERIGLGDQGNRKLLRRMRAHSNCAEYVPLSLLLLLMLELMNGAPLLLWTLGTALVAGRLAHAYGFSQDPELGQLRVAGMALTFAVIISAALANLVLAVNGAFLS